MTERPRVEAKTSRRWGVTRVVSNSPHRSPGNHPNVSGALLRDFADTTGALHEFAMT